MQQQLFANRPLIYRAPQTTQACFWHSLTLQQMQLPSGNSYCSCFFSFLHALSVLFVFPPPHKSSTDIQRHVLYIHMAGIIDIECLDGLYLFTSSLIQFYIFFLYCTGVVKIAVTFSKKSSSN